MNLETTYLGLRLKNPLVPSSSPLTHRLDDARRLEDAGAAAIVMYSLFEEEIAEEQDMLVNLWDFQDIGHGEADSYLPANLAVETELERYLSHLASLKSELEIPVIASLNGVSDSGWLEHALELEAAGADALELNLYQVPADLSKSAAEIEDGYVALIAPLVSALNIPVTVKLSSQFTSPGHFIQRLAQAGARGVSLFNRFYQPDLDLERLEISHSLHLSEPQEALLRMHWIALLYGRVDISLAATGGVHSAQEVLKLLLAGADVTHLCSVLLKKGPEYMGTILADMQRWMEEKEYHSVAQLKGSFSQQHAPNPTAYERANYLKVLRSFEPL